MRNVLATTALLAVSAQAVNMGRLADAISAITDAVGGSDEPVCATGNGVNEDYNASTFQGSYYWRNWLGWWWQQYSVADSFAYFDCQNGNNDGAITFDEFQRGWQYVTKDQNCTELWYDTWLQDYSNSSQIVNRTGYLAAQDAFIQNDTAVTFNGHGGLYHADFYGMRDWKFNEPREDSARKYLASNVPEGRDITPDLYSEHWRDIYKDMWQYWGEVLLTEQINGTEQMPLHYWYAAQYCLSPETYWTALTREWDIMAWESEVSYDADDWADNLCSGLGIGCPTDDD